LLYATVEAFGRSAESRRPRAESRVFAGLILLTLIQVAFGTQVRGGVDAALDAGVARDLALGAVGRLDFIHRDLAFAVLVAAAGLTLWLLSRRAPPLVLRWSFVALGLAILQVALGIVMAYGSLLPAAQVGHLTVASLLLGALTVVWLLSWRQPV
jgi:cytochrome c oxidase assembly protein subunit 15